MRNNTDLLKKIKKKRRKEIKKNQRHNLKGFAHVPSTHPSIHMLAFLLHLPSLSIHIVPRFGFSVCFSNVLVVIVGE